MAYFQRLNLFVRSFACFVVLAIFCPLVIASVPTQSQRMWGLDGWWSGPWVNASSQDACNAVLAGGSAWEASATFTATAGDGQCVVWLKDRSSYKGLAISYQTACPANSTASGASCSCNAGYADDPTKKFCGPAPNAGQEDSETICQALNFLKAPLFINGAPRVTTCYAGVNVTGSGAAGANGKSEVYGPFKCSPPVAGGSCTSEPVLPPKVCPPGSFSGAVNGLDVCVPPASSVATGPSVAASAPSGSTLPTIDGAPAGTTSSTTTTNCAAGACTTTTTYNGSTGSPLGTKNETESQGTYCDKNPKAKICGKPEDGEGSFGGTCSGGFVCKGDAVQCAIAQETHKRNCQIFDTDSPERQAYLLDSEKGKAGTDQSSELKGAVSVNFSSSDFDTTDALGGGSCIGDKTVVVAGKSVIIPFSKICPFLDYLGTILIAVSFLLAGRIIMRG